MENLKVLFSNYNLSKDLKSELIKILKPKNLKKGEIFIQSGEKNNKIGLLIKGLLVATTVSEKGNEMVTKFYYPQGNLIITNHESFYFDRYSSETIAARSNTLLYCISKEELTKLYVDFPKIEKIVIRILQEGYIYLSTRISDLQTLSGKERICKFYKENKPLIDLVTKQQISSYLKINRNDYRIISNDIKLHE